jgi:hypothetical protein
MLKGSTVCIFASILFIIILSCTSMTTKKESWEGIQNNTLRVFVHYEHPDDFDGRVTPSAKEQVKDAARSRAEILLLSYLRMHVTGVEKVITCQQMITGIIEKGTMRRFKCDVQHCTAYVDFDITEFLKAALMHD